MLYLHDLFKDVLMENTDYEFKKRLGTVKTEDWGKSISAFGNCGGGIIFVGVNDNSEVEGLSYSELDKTKRLVNNEVELHIFPYGYRMNRQNVLFGILLDLIMCLRRFPLGWQEGNRENPGTQKAPTYLRRHQRMGLIIPRAVQDIPYCPGTPA